MSPTPLAQSAALRSGQLTVGDSRFTESLTAVIGFERDAWVEAVLRQPSGTNLDRYLATQMCGQV